MYLFFNSKIVYKFCKFAIYTPDRYTRGPTHKGWIASIWLILIDLVVLLMFVLFGRFLVFVDFFEINWQERRENREKKRKRKREREREGDGRKRERERERGASQRAS